MNRLAKFRRKLIEYPRDCSVDEFLQFSIDTICDAMESPIGFLHFIIENQSISLLGVWSTKTKEHFCTAQGEGFHYKVDQAGVWLDCVRQGETVVYNDYKSLTHKKGLPEGHAEVIRFISLPLIRDNIIVAVIGVGNKVVDYTDQDMTVLSCLSEFAWERIEYLKYKETKQILEKQVIIDEKLQLVGTMAGEVAHDLNNIIGIVTGYSELTLDEEINLTVKQNTVQVLSAGKRIAAIVNDLLTLTRRGHTENITLNLNDLLLDCIEQSQYPNYNINLQLCTHLPNIKGSRTQIQSIFMNLIHNAFEAGSSNLVIRTHNRQFVNTVNKECAIVYFIDDGKGIPEDDIDKIFEPFFSKKKLGKKSGTGLGLSIVWNAMKDHNGYIEVESKVGEGTIFKLYFPSTEDMIHKQKVAVEVEQSYQGNGELILVVDDVKEQRDLATRILTRFNYRVVSISSGEEAIEYLKKHNGDLLLLDMRMDPGIDGLTTYQEIVKFKPNQKVIFVSGYTESERIVQAQEAGIKYFIKKPYLRKDLGLIVKNALNN